MTSGWPAAKENTAAALPNSPRLPGREIRASEPDAQKSFAGLRTLRATSLGEREASASPLDKQSGRAGRAHFLSPVLHVTGSERILLQPLLWEEPVPKRRPPFFFPNQVFFHDPILVRDNEGRLQTKPQWAILEEAAERE